MYYDCIIFHFVLLIYFVDAVMMKLEDFLGHWKVHEGYDLWLTYYLRIDMRNFCVTNELKSRIEIKFCATSELHLFYQLLTWQISSLCVIQNSSLGVIQNSSYVFKK